MKVSILGAALAATMLTGAPAFAQTPSEESGLAAVYSDALAGHKTASGKAYNPHKLTAAHKTLPFGTHVKITNVKNGKSVEVVITDRGPRQQARILDISPAAAHAIGIRKHGMGEVKLEVVSSGK